MPSVHEMSDWLDCPHCGLTHQQREDATCPRCGEGVLSSPIPEAHTEEVAPEPVVSAAKKPPNEGMPSWLQITAGLITAVAGGLLWGAVTARIGFGYGWVGWLLGAVVGVVIGLLAGQRAKNTPYLAMGITVVGLLVGNVVSVQWGGAQSISLHLLDNPKALEHAMAIRIALDEPDLAGIVQVSLPSELETITDDPRFAAVKLKAKQTCLQMAIRSRVETANWYGKYLNAKMTFRERLESALSFWDVLWVVLALVTAARIAIALRRPSEP